MRILLENKSSQGEGVCFLESVAEHHVTCPVLIACILEDIANPPAALQILVSRKKILLFEPESEGKSSA